MSFLNLAEITVCPNPWQPLSFEYNITEAEVQAFAAKGKSVFQTPLQLRMWLEIHLRSVLHREKSKLEWQGTGRESKGRSKRRV